MTDLYDEQFPETGSGNISKATPEWKEVLAQARRDVVPGEAVLHRAYYLVNTSGVEWGKCPNCGSPYRLDTEGADATVCSRECFEDYIGYLAEEAEAGYDIGQLRPRRP